MEFDVVIVGAGPSGLAAAIRLKQINPDLSVVVVEKGSEVGAHILSGAVIDPAGFDKLLTDWREDAECPLKTAVSEDRFFWNTAGSAIRLPNFMRKALELQPEQPHVLNYLGYSWIDQGVNLDEGMFAEFFGRPNRHFIAKPFVISDLVGRIRSIVDAEAE